MPMLPGMRGRRDDKVCSAAAPGDAAVENVPIAVLYGLSARAVGLQGKQKSKDKGAVAAVPDAPSPLPDTEYAPVSTPSIARHRTFTAACRTSSHLGLNYSQA